MVLKTSLAVSLSALVAGAVARDVPSNVKGFYDAIVAQKQCKSVLATGFHSIDGDAGSMQRIQHSTLPRLLHDI